MNQGKLEVVKQEMARVNVDDSSGRLPGGGSISGSFLERGEEERNRLEEGHGWSSIEPAAGI